MAEIPAPRDPGLPETPEEWRARHVRLAEKNIAVLTGSGLKFVLRHSPDGLLGASALLREPGKPKVDFFVSTGRWRVVDAPGAKLIRGGARAFLGWYAKQEVSRGA